MTPHVVFAHGFTQTSRSWDVVRALLTQTYEAVSTTAVDLPGHGTAAAVRADLWQAADHLVAAGGRGCYVGYSMGGRGTLHAALAHPDVVSAMVLIGATAGIDDAEGREERRRADELLARQLERNGLAAFVDQWLTNPLFAGLTDDTAGRGDRLDNDAAGLASSLRLAGTGSQEPLWDRLDEITCPTLILVGEHDEKFRTLGDRLCDGIADARLAVVSDAGHSVHLEQPHQTAALIAEFLTTPGG
jgi:2-succinyl-6-hydroxy-2,4-cyclohexadiene-1-carboxylate synthase